MREALSEAIRSVVLPRLVAAHQVEVRSASPAVVTQRDVAALLSHVASPDDSIAEATLQVLRLRGVSREDVLLDLFQVVAQKLGDRWLQDQCSFADVTLGVGRLKRLMRSPAMPQARLRARKTSGRVLFASHPGDQHTFGAAIVEDLFVTAGWNTIAWSGGSAAELEALVAGAEIDVIGISIGEQGMLRSLKPLALRLRRVAALRLVGIIAGGRAFESAFADAETYGVDAIVRDARRAVPTVEALLRAKASADAQNN